MKEILVTTRHPRTEGSGRNVYLARSRRAGGLSVGINLDPQRTCNFDCAYCEVIDRRDEARPRPRPAIDPAELSAELSDVLDGLAGSDLPQDIAFAGDGEPSTYPGFLRLCRAVFDTRDAAGLERIPVVLITNGSGLERGEMVEAHELFAQRGGVFWIKLDAGTEAFFRAVCRTAVPFDRILTNLLAASRRHPVVVQSIFFRWNEAAPAAEEIAAWSRQLARIVSKGGQLRLVQVYTVAREPMDPGVSPLSETRLEEIADIARRALPGIAVQTFA